ncbi:hypothetical protein PRK78_004560 [Emydomyces testavorans]|uniref:DOMON domain-containing protein n=1 Tax=Emydomyces testavorans TaxID=2070801 RepID=A0AAF0DKG0_9EURO|nr:hypothetical protein PRK78_004560 [Emydomyces testavorans]
MLMSLLTWSPAILALASSALGQVVQYSPGRKADGVTFRVNIPSSTASTNSGPIYFQIESPQDSVQWIALGQGMDMNGSNVFILYSASPSNVTLSPRLATGEFQPAVNPKAQISVLEGTGISDGKMRVNVRCDTCLSWPGGKMDPKDPSSSWIWSIKKGSSLHSSNINENLQQHDTGGEFFFDLTKAVGGSSDNPFLASPTSPPSPGSSGSTGSGPSSPPKKISTTQIKRCVHGVIMSIAVVVLFPLFALSLYTVPSSKTVPYIHAPLQLASLCLVIAGFGVGLSLAVDLKVTNGYHQVIGFVMLGCLVLFQPALGLLQHLHFRKTGQRSSFGILHRWSGRLLIILGVVNGGLGFKFSGIGQPGVPKAAVIAYAVIAGIMGLVYVGMVVFKSSKSKDKDVHKSVSFDGNTMPKGSFSHRA